MSFLGVAPEMLRSAAGDLDGIRSALNAANAAAAPSTTANAAPAMDQVSAAITAVLGSYAQEYQSFGAQVAEFHAQFVSALNTGASQYLSTEAANAEQELLNAVNAPAQALLGLSLTGTGASGADAGAGSAVVSGGGLSIPPGGTGETQPVSIPLLNTDTPLGPVGLTVTGTVQLTAGTIPLASGTLRVASEVSLGVDAIGPLLTTATALQNSGTAISNALYSGQSVAPVNALLHTPANAVKGFHYGQQETPTGGTSTVFPLSGTEVGGLVPVLQDEGVLPRF